MHRYFNERLLIVVKKPFGDWFWITLLNKFLKKQLGMDHLNQIFKQSQANMLTRMADRKIQEDTYTHVSNSEKF